MNTDWYKNPIFGFNKKEQKILAILSKTEVSLSITELSIETKIARTTLYTQLEDIKERGLLKTRKIGKEQRVQLNRKLLEQIIENDDSVKIAHIKKYKGIPEILDLFEKTIRKNRRQRLWGVQSTTEVRTICKKGFLPDFVKINNLIKEQKIVTETLFTDTLFPVYANLLDANPKLKKKIFSSLHGRASDSTIVPEKYLKEPIDLVISSKGIIFADWKNEWALDIQSASLSKFFLEIFVILKSTGFKIDFNKQLIKSWEAE